MSWIDPVVSISRSAAEHAALGSASPRRQSFRFAATLGALLGGLGFWKIWSGRSSHAGRTLVVVAVALVVWSLVHPTSVLLFRRLWLRVGGLLGRVNSVVLLTVLYVLVVTPLGLWLRFFRRRSFTPAPGGSYFVDREADRGSKHFEHPY